MRALEPTAALMVIALALPSAGCGGGTRTVTERGPSAAEVMATPKTPVTSAPRQAKLALNNPAQQPDPSVSALCNEVPEGHACHAVTASPSDPNESPQRNCDTNIVANANTSCGLAENVFYEYYQSRDITEKYPAVMAYSATTSKNYELSCDHTGKLVACTSSPLSQELYVSFPQAAVDAYTEAQATAYASTRSIGRPGVTAAKRTEEQEARESASSPGTEPTPKPQESEESRNEHSGDQSFCSTHECIGEYESEPGTVVECSDGSFSHAGGIQGACSHHGGER